MERKNTWETYDSKTLKKVDKFCDDYRVFLDEGKTERECIDFTVNMIEKEGYIDYLDAFINETLLPFISKKYSIDLNNVGISGSSMGGLGCHYIGLKNLGKYKFILSADGTTAKVPIGAFSESEIDNDIMLVINALEDF